MGSDPERCEENAPAASPLVPLINFSSLEEWENCERHYWYSKIDGQEKPTNETLEVGTLYHAVIAALIISPTGVKALPGLIEEKISLQKESLTKLGLSVPALRAELNQNLPALWHDVIVPGKLKPLVDDAGPRVERQFANTATGFRGTCDLVSATTPKANARGAVTGSLNEPCILDWKTLTSFNRRTQRDADRSMQLALYAWEADVPNAAFVEIPRFAGRDIVVRVTHYTPAQRRMWAAYLTGQKDALLSRGTARENFKRASRKSGLCDPKWCPYYGQCLGTDHLTEEEADGTLPI